MRTLSPSEAIFDRCKRLETQLGLYDYNDYGKLLCELQIRLYFYSIGIAICCHVTSIMLAMAFINAFNEAARDCDIIRMFAEGK